MWPDNETDIDLLGFDYLVDQLEVLVTTKRLLPVTVLVSGDWGSGKSSLMEVTRQRLEAPENKDKFICVSFTPWRFEDFRYGKVALMATVVDAIADYAENTQGVVAGAIDKANALRRTLHRWGIVKQAAAFGAEAAGLDAEQADVLGSAAQAAAGAGSKEEGEEEERTFESVAHFHARFEELIEDLGDKLQTVVVFIDDMDRCVDPATIVETFEAMRLFMHAPKTAYVIGAHADIVEAALDSRYAGRQEGDDRLGKHWLEKMLQHRVAVPPLGQPEVTTYVTLLLAELHTTPEQFALLRAAADENRASNPFQVAINEGAVGDILNEVSEDLAEVLSLSTRIGPVLAQNMRGNPRETKTFLNDFFLRWETSKKRNMGLDAGVLAKLMLLEELLDNHHFERVFKWYLDADSGAPEELRLAEQLARDPKAKGVPADVSEWVAQPAIADWLGVDPPLAGINLGPYFTFSRDRLKGLLTAPKLPLELQNLLIALQNDRVPPLRTKAVNDTVALEPVARAKVLPALLSAADVNLDGPAAMSLIEIAQEAPEVATTLFDHLDKLAVSKVKGTFVLTLSTAFKSDARLQPLLERWSERGKADVKRQALRGLAAGKGGS